MKCTIIHNLKNEKFPNANIIVTNSNSYSNEKKKDKNQHPIRFQINSINGMTTCQKRLLFISLCFFF